MTDHNQYCKDDWAMYQGAGPRGMGPNGDGCVCSLEPKEDKEVPLTIELPDGTKPVIGTAKVHPDGTVTGTFNPKMVPATLIEKIMPQGPYSIEPKRKFITPEPEIEYTRFFEEDESVRNFGDPSHKYVGFEKQYPKNPIIPPDMQLKNPKYEGPLLPLNKFACVCPWNNGYDRSAVPRHNLNCPALMGEHFVGDKCGPHGHTNFESDMEGTDGT